MVNHEINGLYMAVWEKIFIFDIHDQRVNDGHGHIRIHFKFQMWLAKEKPLAHKVGLFNFFACS